MLSFQQATEKQFLTFITHALHATQYFSKWRAIFWKVVNDNTKMYHW